MCCSWMSLPPGWIPKGAHEIEDLIVRLNQEFGITIFMNTHQLDRVTRMCTSIGILNHGRLVVSDSLNNIVSRFADDRSLEEIYLHFEHNGWTTETGDTA